MRMHFLNKQNNKNVIFFTPSIMLNIDDMLTPFRTNYILYIAFLWWKIRITWYKEVKNGIQRNI